MEDVAVSKGKFLIWISLSYSLCTFTFKDTFHWIFEAIYMLKGLPRNLLLILHHSRGWGGGGGGSRAYRCCCCLVAENPATAYVAQHLTFLSNFYAQVVFQEGTRPKSNSS
jgi:hypothetical protein